MVWRILFILLKSALMVALFEFVRPVADVIGLQPAFVDAVAGAISRATALPHWEAEILFLLALAVMLSQIARIVWDLITGCARCSTVSRFLR